MTTARLVCVLILVALTGPGCGRSGNAGPPQVRIGGGVWNVELATQPQSRHRGLGGRDEVPEGAGMLFVFPDEKVRTFHMLNCSVPLDIAFISSNLIIVEIRRMRVEADPSDPKVTYSSRRPAQYALEVGGGGFGRSGVSVGDRVELLGAARNAAKDAR